MIYKMKRVFMQPTPDVMCRHCARIIYLPIIRSHSGSEILVRGLAASQQSFLHYKVNKPTKCASLKWAAFQFRHKISSTLSESLFAAPMRHDQDPTYVLAAGTAFPVLCIIVVSLRFYARYGQKARYGPDDWLSLFALVSVCPKTCLTYGRFIDRNDSS